MITTARYIVPTNDQIIVDEQTTMHWPSNTHWDAKVQACIDDGNTIAPYDEWYGRTDDDIRELRKLDNMEYMYSLMATAETNPEDGVTLTDREVKKNQLRRDIGAKHKNNKNKNTDDAMIDFQYQLVADLEAADDMLDAITVRQDLINWVPTNASWTPWVAPAYIP